MPVTVYDELWLHSILRGINYMQKVVFSLKILFFFNVAPGARICAHQKKGSVICKQWLEKLTGSRLHKERFEVVF